MYNIFWLENLKGREHLEDQAKIEDNIRMYLRERGWD
jgi:hypothetical protein